MDFKSFSKKQKITIIASAILILAIPLTAYLAKQTQIFKPRAQEVIPIPTSAPKITDSHPEIFYALLEYNTEAKTVTQINTGKIRGDLPPLLQSPPSVNSGRTMYKIEVFSAQNGLLQSGWGTIPISHSSQAPQFQLFTVYEAGSQVKLYLQNDKLVWQGTM